MIPVVTASAAPPSPAQLAALADLERAADLAPEASTAAAELASALPLWALLAADWTPTELAAQRGRLLRRIVPWVASGLLPPARRPGQDAAAYAAALDAAALRLAASPRARDARAVGRQIRRFAGVPALAAILASPELRAAGALASRQWPALASLALTLASREPRSGPTGHDTASGPAPIDWDAEDRRARAEREARTKATRAEFDGYLKGAAAAYATATAAFPALAVAAPAVAAALALGKTFFEGFISVSRLLSTDTGNSQANRERAASELAWWTQLGVPPLVFDSKLWNAAGYADTLAKMRGWYGKQAPDVQGALRDLGVRLKRVGAADPVANAGASKLAQGPAGLGPVFGGAVFTADPAAQVVADRMGKALADVYAADYAAQGFSIPEARAKQAAIDAYHAVLTDKKIAEPDKHGLALARAVQNYVYTADLGRTSTAPPASSGSGAAVVAGLGLAALLFL